MVDVKRSSWVGLLAAGGLLLTGCSSGGDTAASTTAAATSAAATTAASTTAVSTTAASITSPSSSTSKSTSAAGSAASSGAPAAQLDEATETWFSTFCSNLADVGRYAAPDTAGQSLDQIQATVITSYTGISTSATAAAAALQATPPPTIASGDEIASATTAGFQSLADVYGRGAQTISALTLTSEADLKTAVDEVEAEAKNAAPNSLADLDPGVETAVKELPDCADVLGS